MRTSGSGTAHNTLLVRAPVPKSGGGRTKSEGGFSG